jgi:Transposase domain (DUF772)
MKPKKTEHKPQRELFRVELSFLVDNNHPLVKLGSRINWTAFDEHLAPTYHDKMGAPGIDTRLMVALHYLKYQHDLSDEAVVAGWAENPYWQHWFQVRSAPLLKDGIPTNAVPLIDRRPDVRSNFACSCSVKSLLTI